MANLGKMPPSTKKTLTKRTASGGEEDGTLAKRTRRTRCSGTTVSSNSSHVMDLTSGTAVPREKKVKALKKAQGKLVPERRAKVFRKRPPRASVERLARARSQRMFVVGSTIDSTRGMLEMRFDVVGSTGNLYKTTIGKIPICDCPDGKKGNQCKHICYLLSIVLKAPAHLQYQAAFLSTELEDIYQKSSLVNQQSKVEDNDGKRKPIGGDCPICFMELNPANEQIVWCRAACGNNIHKVCFDQWAATPQLQGIRCVYCRSLWETDTNNVDVDSLTREGQVNQEGYVNVASRFGLPVERDYSTYNNSPYWF